jgi:hypothetical protein
MSGPQQRFTTVHSVQYEPWFKKNIVRRTLPFPPITHASPVKKPVLTHVRGRQHHNSWPYVCLNTIVYIKEEVEARNQNAEAQDYLTYRMCKLDERAIEKYVCCV